jgi:hypothetical protein
MVAWSRANLGHVKKAENTSWAGMLNIIYFSWSGWGVFKTSSHLHENENIGRLLHAASVD